MMAPALHQVMKSAAMLVGLLMLTPATLHAAPDAAPIADPTRPARAASDVLDAARARRGESPGPAAPTAWPQLQAVQVAPDGQSTAMLDGRVVRLGERVGVLTLVAIDAQGILLRGPRYEQRMALMPGIVKTASSSPDPELPGRVNLAAKESR